MSIRNKWIGGGETDLEREARVHEQRQIDQVRKEGNEHRQQRQDAIILLAKAREQLLALSMLMYEWALTEHDNGDHDTVLLLHELAHMVRDVRANRPVPELARIAKEPKGI